ncbi:hypothetical protein SUGI_0403020 [Cryptomeria japonica]|uniref:protein SULFUR DEFICIENCY-INDUCED 2 n=1 Tax=Cryptomeria japonica TaxID=3369 RepID=UPI002408CA81|nr:protein SULFUR DEFICIENCY-INDUCED 2 [Cryptomeria japonica]GLJ21642.1 hypothetical protein SUGI_0403020 [Cryptomeria japonica]
MEVRREKAPIPIPLCCEEKKLTVSLKKDPLHTMYKVPFADTPYGRAKHLQLVDKDPEGAIALFWQAINAGDRVDSALKDMAVVMKQHNRSEEAIAAIKSFRHLCSDQAQESLDNVLFDLYKKCGRLDEQIELLKHKLCLIQRGAAFNGKATKTARSHGKKFQLSIKQETTRLLGNLGWAYMQQLNFAAAEIVYRKAQLIDPDENKACNLSICLMKQGKVEEAINILQASLSTSKEHKPLDRTEELLKQIQALKIEENATLQAESDLLDLQLPEWNWSTQMGRKRNRLRVFEQMTAVAF